jgi:hypothetical protein
MSDTAINLARELRPVAHSLTPSENSIRGRAGAMMDG